MFSSRICIDLVNRYKLDSVLRIDQCTLLYCIGLFSRYFHCTVIEVLLWNVLGFGEQILTEQRTP